MFRNKNLRCLLCFILLLENVLLFFACDSQHRQFEQIVKEWNNKTIIFPENMVFTKYTSDTIVSPSMDTDYKILMYINNSGCMNCRMNLLGWESFIKSIDTITTASVSFLFFIYPDDINNIRYILHRNRFEYPVCIDLKDTLNTLNHFPIEYDFQTFLLDKNNKVICIGNPIRNLSIRSLYYEIINKRHCTKEIIKKDVMENFLQEIDLGTFSSQEPQESYFSIHNQGQEDIRIKEIISSCECITVEPEKERIAPGEDARVYLIYYAEEPGEFFREVYIRMNNGKEFVVHLKGKALF